MNYREQLVPLGHPNRPGTKLETPGHVAKAIVFHYTANDSPGATDTANAKYFGRPWVSGANEKPFEKDGVTPFAYGSAHIIADEDSVTCAVPTDEVAWACGDRHAMPWTENLRGQRLLAKAAFGNRQNYLTVSVEICNNGDWDKACAVAAEWAAAYIRNRNLELMLEDSLTPPAATGIMQGKILLCRHYDLTGKRCPLPFIASPEGWIKLVKKIAGLVRA